MSEEKLSLIESVKKMQVVLKAAKKLKPPEEAPEEATEETEEG